VLSAATLNLGEKETIEFFTSWKGQHGKEYHNENEAIYRYSVWKHNLAQIIEHNSKNLGWTMGINQFTDLTAQEFADQYLSGFHVDEIFGNYTTTSVTASDVDWFAKGKVSPVKDQKTCGSCWAFSAVGALESMNLIKGNSLTTYSEQELVDCDPADHGCQGGLPHHAFEYVDKNGLSGDGDYPYKGVKESCSASKYTPKINPTAFEMCSGNEGTLSKCLANGPVSVGVDASYWQHYHSGVLDACICIRPNHAVLAVAQTDGVWTIKNSWSTGWGEKGFIRLPAGKSCSCLGVYGVRPLN
jgi:hypothetical protein